MRKRQASVMAQGIAFVRAFESAKPENAMVAAAPK